MIAPTHLTGVRFIAVTLLIGSATILAAAVWLRERLLHPEPTEGGTYRPWEMDDADGAA